MEKIYFLKREGKTPNGPMEMKAGNTKFRNYTNSRTAATINYALIFREQIH